MQLDKSNDDVPEMIHEMKLTNSLLFDNSSYW